MTLTLDREPQQRRHWGRIVARAWDDDDFRQRLLAEPEAVLREEGIEVPPGIEIRVEEGEAGDTTCLRLPPKPDIEDLIQDFDATPGSLVGRSCHGWCVGCCCYCRR